MPAVSGWALRPVSDLVHAALQRTRFLCPRFRAGLCDRRRQKSNYWTPDGKFLCPRFRAGLCDQLTLLMRMAVVHSFYALGFGLGFATTCGTTTSRSISCFYALGFGLGFATTVLFWVDDAAVWLFLCPRFRAGLCDPSLIWSMLPCRGLGFYALGFGLGFVTTCGTTTSRSISCFYALGFGLGFATTVLFWVDDAA